jgi:glycosyltransferase involved in cell wall biosynthesis
MTSIGVVAIARNEGERLRRCLESLCGNDLAVVYVDSGSSDGSVALAQTMGVEVVELDMTIPFTAARSRNAGFARLMEINPDAKYVQFLDGDCQIADGWLESAQRVMEDQPRAAVVFGLRRECYPERSLYNRLADIEWNMAIGNGGPDGEPESCGGDAMVRGDAFQSVDGYNPSIPAGEEPEFCKRLRSQGWSIVRCHIDMTWHDSAMLRFHQWAKRQFRTGYGGLDFSTRFGQSTNDPFRRQIVSARVWGLGWPVLWLVGSELAWIAGGPWFGIATAILLLMPPIAQAARIASKNRQRAGSLSAAGAYGLLTMLGKVFQAAGQCLYLCDHRAGRHARLIEYKSAEANAHA